MKHFARVMLCLLLVVCCVLSACEKSDGTEEQTTQKKNPQKTTAAATTEAPEEIKIPEKLVAQFEIQGKALSRLWSDPVIVQIDEKTSIDLAYQAWPTICKGEGETLYAASSLRRYHIDPFAVTAFYVSNDNGKTWSEPRIVNDGPLDDRDTGIVYMGNGRMLISFFTIGADQFQYGGQYSDQWGDCTAAQKAAKEKEWASLSAAELKGGSWVILSDDYGQTWSEPIKSPVSAPHGPNLANDGTLIYCGSGNGGIQIHQSRDYGRTWKLRATVPTPDPGPLGLNYYGEPYVVQLRDGSFVVGIRAQHTDKGSDTMRVYISYSKDGYNFTEAKELEGVVGSPPHFLELSNGALLLTYSYRYPTSPQEQPGIRGRVSYDGGKTWDKEIIVAVGAGDMGYPSTIELDDGTLITTYYMPYKGDKHPSVLYSRWKLVEPTE